MRRCLRDKELVLLHEGDGRPADRNHLDTCARCAGRYRQLADDLLMESGVALLPGTAFGAAGAGFLRLAYTQGEEDLRIGLERMGNHLAARVKA